MKEEEEEDGIPIGVERELRFELELEKDRWDVGSESVELKLLLLFG